ncbi:MAG: hypothetical protein NZ533_07525, partial [Casimicrobiaceae bacterium]|nr:hypothetical protein [Casimicrobiaceae bacterium]MDW8312836.1 hypothetical protein [Burkholderiales bacterium]
RSIGFYYPDWVVVQKTASGEANWIVETKGRVWEGTAAKDEALTIWCERISAAVGATWKYLRVNQADFDRERPGNFEELMRFGIRREPPTVLV